MTAFDFWLFVPVAVGLGLTALVLCWIVLDARRLARRIEAAGKALIPPPLPPALVIDLETYRDERRRAHRAAFMAAVEQEQRELLARMPPPSARVH